MMHTNDNRKIILWEFFSLDGVMESPEQWINPYFSEDLAGLLQELNLSCDAMLLGRSTYEAFITFWPFQTHNEFGYADKLNAMPKYVISTTLEKAGWNNSTVISQNSIEEIARLKQASGGDMGITGSTTLVRSLIQARLIDEFYFIVFPIVLGNGFRLFQEGQTLSLKLVESKSYSSGVVLLHYRLG